MRILTLSFACNNACIFCAQGKLREASESIDAESAVREVARTLIAGETIALAGGEPTLHERLPDWIQALDAAGAGRIVVQSNGRRLAYRAYASRLREASRRLALDVSLAGSTEPMHDYHTTTPGSFKQTVVGLRNAHAEGIPASVSCVVTRSNFRHLTEIVRLCRALDATGVRFVPAHALGAARELRDRVVPALELLAPYLAQAQAEAKKLGLALRVDVNGAPEEGAAGAFAGLGAVELAAAPAAAASSTAPIARADRSRCWGGPRLADAKSGRPSGGRATSCGRSSRPCSTGRSHATSPR